MLRLLPLVMTLGLLAACGAAGLPVPPATTPTAAPTAAPGLSVTGSATAGAARNGG